MQLRRVAPEIHVGVSRIWQTTHTICGTDGALVIDSPVTVCEQAALAADVTAAMLIATHADWDHLVAPLAFPDATRYACPATIRRLREDHAEIAADMARWDAVHGQPPRVLPDWRCARAVTVPTTIGSAVGPVEVVGTSGHTRDGIALLVAAQEVLVVGDYLSPCEIPSLAQDARWEDYLETLELLERLIGRARCVVPGHGWPLDAARARAILVDDRNYVLGLGLGTSAPLPRQRANPSQQAQHRANLAAVRGG